MQMPDLNDDVAVLTDWADEVERHLRPPSEHGTHPEYALEYTERKAKLRALRNAVVALKAARPDGAAVRGLSRNLRILAGKHAQRLRNEIAACGCPKPDPVYEALWCGSCVDRDQVAMILEAALASDAGDEEVRPGLYRAKRSTSIFADAGAEPPKEEP